ncbi:mitochondrial carrier domain-containing protein [Jimgerdemannia flammicorona]|uniref:Mitochondrial carrier domain-containing protein n=1 Tax=Jimgerdemannia flammicorona TaxID=994334 RepID=A0A432ZZF4_9FUNG|nr:mitochondrial carrier domain-containing protein [Jimgerdemannia flammicorona]
MSSFEMYKSWPRRRRDRVDRRGDPNGRGQDPPADSMADPFDIPKYRNAGHAAYTIVREEGISALYKGVSPRRSVQNLDELPSYQYLILGGVSGAMGPLSNAPIDTIKTRIQRSSSTEPGWRRFIEVITEIVRKEGWPAFYKGLTPRLLRVAPGQAVTFMVYEKVKGWIEVLGPRY